MILPLLHRPLTKLSQIDLPLALFWSGYLALWPGIFWWWAHL